LRNHLTPVVAPLAVTNQGVPLNCNADTAAAAIAGALKADLFVLLTDVPGVLVPNNGSNALAPLLTADDLARLKRDGVVQGGMIPKVDCCLQALRQGAKSSVIASMDNFVGGGDLSGTKIVESTG
jgi:acetylglutamate kinase